jgi:hypothetical protein
MGKLAFAFVAPLAALAANFVLAQGADDPQIKAAIELGQKGKASEALFSCTVFPSVGQTMATTMRSGPTPIGNYRLHLGTNIGKVASLAEEAKKKYLPYATTDVPQDLLKPAVHVWVDPAEPRRRADLVEWTPPLTHMVLKSDAVVVQPGQLNITPVEWVIITGKYEGTKATATFPIAAVKAIPPGGIDIVLITSVGERKCRIGQNDRKRLGLF